MKIFVAAGEVSGDIHASLLIKGIKEARPDVEIAGVGGPHMMATGVKLIDQESVTYSTVGILESLRFLLPKLRLMHRIIKPFLLDWKPDIVVFVDNQGFNIPLARMVRKLLPYAKTAYYFPPPVWIWAEWNASKLAHLVDLVLAIFPKEVPIYKSKGAEVEFVGHPFIDVIKPAPNPALIRQKLKVPLGAPVIGILPGSRFQELEKLTRIFLKAADLLQQIFPEAVFPLLISHPKYEEIILRETALFPHLNLRILPGPDSQVLSICDAAMVASGTVTLESALLGVPHVVVYKIGFITFNIARLLVKVKNIALSNLLLGDTVVPELLQSKARPEIIAYIIEQWIKRPEIKREISARLRGVSRVIGPPGAIKRAAMAVLSLAR